MSQRRPARLTFGSTAQTFGDRLMHRKVDLCEWRTETSAQKERKSWTRR